jgi:hypothetical protein
MKSFNRLALSTVLAAGSVSSVSAAVLLSENFEGLPLNPFQSPTEQNGDGTDWSSVLPAGWTLSLGATPIGNPVEFQGWHVLDVDSWIATEGNQQRGNWTRGGVGSHGSVLVADADAYDDGTNIDTALFNTWASTPKISLNGWAANSVTIEVDSFWRNEVTQIGKLEVSYDGGTTFKSIKTYDSAALADGLVIDEHLNITVDNPTSGDLVVRFGLTDGSNDWWWAVDNVTISATAVPEPSTIALGALGFAALLLARRRKE